MIISTTERGTRFSLEIEELGWKCFPLVLGNLNHCCHPASVCEIGLLLFYKGILRVLMCLTLALLSFAILFQVLAISGSRSTSICTLGIEISSRLHICLLCGIFSLFNVENTILTIEFFFLYCVNTEQKSK